MTNAVAYLRVSGKGQDTRKNDDAATKDGFTRQRIAIERYAEANGLEITGWYQDVQTGKDEWETRPGWSEMVSKLNGVRTILVEKLDRVARAVLVQELIIRDLQRREVRLVTSAGDDTADESPERIMFRQLLAVFAAYERNTLTLKLRGARQRMKEETGRCEGRKPYGFHPAEQPAIEMMRSLRTQGYSYAVIAETLSVYPTRTGKPWRGEVIRKILARQKGTK